MQFDTPRWFHDSATRCIRLVGKDTRKYLQTKLTRNVKPWKPGQAEYAMAVNINGQALFDGEFIFLDEHILDLWVTADVANDAFEHLEKYVITEDVTLTLTDADSWCVVCDNPAALDEELESLSLDADAPPSADSTGYLYRRPRAVAPSFRVVNPAALSSSLPAALAERDAIEESDLLTEEVRRGLPRFGEDFFREATIPLEAGISEGVDFNKGCYLGQEVIERLHSRGTPARRLAHVSWAGPPVPANTELSIDGRNAGFVTRSVAADENSVALAYIRRKYLDRIDEIAIDGIDTTLRVERIIGES